VDVQEPRETPKWQKRRKSPDEQPAAEPASLVLPRITMQSLGMFFYSARTLMTDS
jgi:hypothetical protein